MKTARVSFVGLCFATFAAACGSPSTGGTPGAAGSGGPAGAAGTGNTTGAAGTGNTTGAAGTGNTTGAAGTGNTTGAAGTGGTTGAAGTGNTSGTAGTTGVAGTGGSGPAGTTGAAGAAGRGGAAGGTTGMAGRGGAGGTSAGGSGGAATPSSVLVTSASGAYWKVGTLTESTASATVTVNDTSAQQKWDGFGGAFNELGWKYLTSAAMQTQAVTLLFSATDGAHFAWGRIPMGASDYAEIRYTLLDTTGADPAPNSGETNRPAESAFSLSRDTQRLIPYIQAAQAINPALRFWASPWTPPISMKTGYKKEAASPPGGTARKPSYYDGGNMKSDATTLTAYADYYKKFVEGYKAMGINIEIVSPQNEPGYDQNYPSCLWDATTYKTFIGTYLGPAMQPLGVKIMLGSLSNDMTDFSIAMAAAADSKAKPFLAVIGAQWNTLDKARLDGLNSGLPVWASEHKCGNYPWITSSGTMGCGEANDPCPVYNNSQAPNDQAYGVESWKYIRNAIKTVKVTGYNAWNMVLDRVGLGNDTSRDWKQDALLVANGGTVTATPAYYVFRHLSQYVDAGHANVVATTGGDAVAFKNEDGSIVVAMYNSGAANANYVVAIGGKKFQFAMPAAGWATVKYKP